MDKIAISRLTYYHPSKNSFTYEVKEALFLITMGGSLKDKVRRDQLEAMKTVMVGDRIRNRAKTCEVYAFDEMTRGYGNDDNRDERWNIKSEVIGV